MSHRIVVHCGLPKTASTLLQRDVFPLFDGRGVTYRGKSSPGVWKKPQEWIGVRDYVLSRHDRARQRAIAEVRQSESLDLFSSEDLLNPFGFRAGTLVPERVSPFERLDRLIDTVGNQAELFLLMVLRDPVRWLESFHYECLKQGYVSTVRIKDFIEQLNEPPGWIDAVLHFEHLHDALRARYPNARLRFVALDHLLDHPGPALADMQAFLGTRIECPDLRQRRVNVRHRHPVTGNPCFSWDSAGFATRRRLRQQLEPDLEWSDRLAAGRFLMSLWAGSLRTVGLPRIPARDRARLDERCQTSPTWLADNVR